MKRIFLVLSFLIPSYSLNAANYSLSKEAKDDIVINTISGSTMGFIGALLAQAYIDPNGNLIPALAAAGIGGGALAGAIYGYFFNADKQFERNIQKHWENSCDCWETIKTNQAIDRLRGLKDQKILNLELWYLYDNPDAMFSEFPLLMAYKFLVNKKYELKRLEALFNKIADFSCDSSPRILNHQNHEQFVNLILVLENAITVIENSKEYQIQDKLYQDSLPKYQHKPIQVTHTAPQPVYVTPTVVKPVVYTHPATPMTVAKPAATLSPVLNGNVYGTIWANY